MTPPDVSTGVPDDEVAFYASDAGTQAPLDAAGPAGTLEDTRQEVALTDPPSGEVNGVVCEPVAVRPGRSP